MAPVRSAQPALSFRWSGLHPGRYEYVSVTAVPVATVSGAEIDLDAIGANARLLGTRRPGAALMAVVKADGFGHGMVRTAQAAVAAGASWLGVASVVEAVQLRSEGLTTPILTWLHGPDADFATLLRVGVDISAATEAQLDAIAAAAQAVGRRAPVHLKIDTGMTRGGAAAADWPALVRHAASLPDVWVRAVWTHLACADEPGQPGVAEQLERFEVAVAQAHAAGLAPQLRHAANSAAILSAPAAHFDVLRAGIALYGPEPVPGHPYGLRGAMTVRTRVVEAGAAGTILPLGAAHGVPVTAAGTAEVLLDGDRRRVLTVALDHLVVAGRAAPGAPAILFGPGTAGEPTAVDWADWGGTNPHEVLIGVGCRVPRAYAGDGTGEAA